MITHADCPLTHSIYNRFVGIDNSNGHGKRYKLYRCRGCHERVSRDEMCEKIKEVVATVELTESGKLALKDAIEEVFDLEAGDIEAERVKLLSQRKNAENEADRLSDAYSREPDGPIRDHLNKRLRMMLGRVKKYDEDLDKLARIEVASYHEFAKYALDFIDDLVGRFFELTPSEMKKCKQLLFPSGFFYDSTGNVYTHVFSPIYRWPETKNDSFESDNSPMVRVKRL